MTHQLLRRVLVVEDEMLVAMLVEDMVRDLGHEVVGPAMTLDAALLLAEGAAVDCAILDMNLGDGTPSTPVALVLAGRHIPFLFATGYGAAGANANFAEAPVLEKPFIAEHLGQALQRLMR
jgi:CheY-like chemotaxis protein